jgi:hypothetical protein
MLITSFAIPLSQKIVHGALARCGLSCWIGPVRIEPKYLSLRCGYGHIEQCQDNRSSKIDLWGPGELGAFGTKIDPIFSGSGEVRP